VQIAPWPEAACLLHPAPSPTPVWAHARPFSGCEEALKASHALAQVPRPAPRIAPAPPRENPYRAPAPAPAPSPAPCAGCRAPSPAAPASPLLGRSVAAQLPRRGKAPAQVPVPQGSQFLRPRPAAPAHTGVPFSSSRYRARSAGLVRVHQRLMHTARPADPAPPRPRCGPPRTPLRGLQCQLPAERPPPPEQHARSPSGQQFVTPVHAGRAGSADGGAPPASPRQQPEPVVQGGIANCST